MTNFTANTTFGELEFSFSGATMNVTNLSNGVQIYSGEPSQDEIDAAYGDRCRITVAQEFADNFYSVD